MHKPEIRPLLVSTLVVDPAIQRPLDMRRVTKIAAELNLDALGVLTISQRANGTHVIIDGQHRAEALKAAGRADHKATCRIFSGLAPADEAAMFRLLNNTAKPQYIDIFRVRVIEGEKIALSMSRMAERHGWTIGSGGGSGVISAVQAFERIYLMDEVAAEKALTTVTRAWGYDEVAVDGRILEGIGLVYVRYGEAVATDDLIDRLARFAGGAGNLLGKARGLKELVGSTLARAVAEIVVEEYNRRRKTKGLPPFRTT